MSDQQSVLTEFTERADALVDWANERISTENQEAILDLFAEMCFTLGDDDAAHDPVKVTASVVGPHEMRFLIVEDGYGDKYQWSMMARSYWTLEDKEESPLVLPVWELVVGEDCGREDSVAWGLRREDVTPMCQAYLGSGDWTEVAEGSWEDGSTYMHLSASKLTIPPGLLRVLREAGIATQDDLNRTLEET